MEHGKPPARRAFLFSLRADGSPTCHPMHALGETGAPVFNTYRKSAKAQNLLRDPRAAVLQMDDWAASPATAELVAGVVEEIEPPAAAGAGPGDGQAQHVPSSVSQRVAQRVTMGKRMHFRLRARG
jgi:hypothetical protein